MKYAYLLIVASIFTSCTIFNGSKSENSLKQHVKYLASDELEGRYPASKGGQLAAQYIKNEFNKADLTLMADDGFQYFEIISSVELGDKNKLIFNNKIYEAKKDYIPLSFGMNTSLSAQIFFAGYGFIIDNETMYWNDFEGKDVKDKWVMILRGSPDGDNPHGNFSEHLSLRKKVLNAKDNFAAGVIFVSGTNFDADDNLIELTYDQNQQDLGIPIIHIKRDLANQILKSENKTIKGLESEISKDFQSFNIYEDLIVDTDIKFNTKETQNVIGVKFGNDPELKDEYIIIGAHYDHLGYGGDKSGSRRPHINEVHNGADDNASGVSIVIELAKSFKKINNKRSIIFIAFGAEEMGLIGSKFFVNSSLIENKNIQTMINFDMVGKLKSEKILNVSGTKTGLELESYLVSAFEDSSLDYAFDAKGYGPSDHSSFYVNDVPVLFFFTGGHTDYHTPFDDYDKLNYNGMHLIKELIFNLIKTIDIKPKVNFQESGPKSQESMPSRFKVTLGIMPDYVYNKTKGLRVDAVLPEKPADLGGIKDGDIIIKIDNKSVSDIYEYMHRLSEYNKGDKVEIIVLRDGKQITTQVTF